MALCDNGKSISDEERQALFNKIVLEHGDEIRSLVRRYTYHRQFDESNYNYTLEQMFRYCHTYNPERPIHTWVHIVTKRACMLQNKKQIEHDSHYDGDGGGKLSQQTFDALYGTATPLTSTNVLDNISDEMYDALMQMPPLKLSAFLLKVQGYSIKEIAKIEYQRGHLDKPPQQSIEIVKSRVYWCRKQLRNILLNSEYARKRGLSVSDDDEADPCEG